MKSNADRATRRTAIVFVLVVAFGLAQVAWWTFFQLREVALRGRSTRVAHYEQPVFAWK